MAEYIEREYALNLIIEDNIHPLPFIDLIEEIKNLPAADVAPVIRGTWNLLRHDKFSDVFQCSECGRKVSLTHGQDVLEQFPYCHCGAKMGNAPCREHQP